MPNKQRFMPDRFASYDLHLHSHWSYDAFAPLDLHFRWAAELGLRCISITEHHNLDSQPEIRELAARYPQVCCIPGAELSVTTSFGSQDLLCYGLPDAPPPGLKRVLDAYHEWQREWGAAFVRGMRVLGYDYTEEHQHEVLDAYRPEKTIRVQGYTHVRNGTLADYFVKRGFISDIEGYQPLKARAIDAVGWVPYPRVEDVVPAVHEAGGVVALAHPYGYFGGDDREKMDGLREECALDGLECAHPGVPPDYTPIYRAYCEERGMFSVGGSDAHNEEDFEARFARHLGEDAWLDEFLKRLEAR